jgi:hypothetical protein
MIRTLLIASFVCSVFVANAATAALIAYEPFDYAPVGSPLLGRSSGFGFSGAWRAGGFNASTNNNYGIANDSLAFGDLLRSGNSISTPPVGAIAGLTRDLASPLGQSDSTVYMSMLIQPQDPLHGGAFNGFFGIVFEAAG